MNVPIYVSIGPSTLYIYIYKLYVAVSMYVYVFVQIHTGFPTIFSQRVWGFAVVFMWDLLCYDYISHHDAP